MRFRIVEAYAGHKISMIHINPLRLAALVGSWLPRGARSPLDLGVLVLIALLFASALVIALLTRRSGMLASRRGARPVAMTLALLAVVGVWARFVEPRWVVLTTTRVRWSGPPLRVAVLGDIHAGRTSVEVVERAVRLTNEASPDMVILVGDYITGYNTTPEKLSILEALRPLRARHGVFAVLGNHDSEPFQEDTPRAEALTRFLEGMSFTVLRNATREIIPGVTLVGLDEVRSGNIDPARAFRGVTTASAQIVATHDWHGLLEPGIRPFDVAVTGHTHGGQLCVPLIDYCPFGAANAPYINGLFSWPQGGQLFVTRGIGESAVLARFACRPEVAMLELAP